MKINIRWAFAALLLAFGSTGWGQTNTFTKFAPATGVLKGSSTTYVTTAAVAADIKGLWTGTCDATTFLRGDGACATASSSPGGANTQVQFNSSGSFGGNTNFTWDNTNHFLILNGAGGGVLESATAKPLSLIGGDVIADITSSSITLGSNGSSGNGGGITLTAGPAATSGAGGAIALNAGNGTGSLQSGGSVSLSAGSPGAGGAGGVLAFYTAGGTLRETINADGGVTVGSPTGGSQGAGTVNMTGCFVNGVACSTGGASGANPTGTIGLTAVNGSAGTFLRSDGAPPLSQAISPTWTGTHTFSASSGNNVTITNNNSGVPLSVTGSAGRSAFLESAGNGNVSGTSSMAIGQDSSGINKVIGRNNATLLIGTNNATHITDNTDGGIVVGSATGGDKGAGTLNAVNLYVNGTAVSAGGVTQTTGTFTTALVSGCSSGGVGTVHYTKTGNVATLTFDNSLLCPANTTFGQVTYSGLPSAVQPTNGILSQSTICQARGQENSVGTLYSITINSTTSAFPGQFTGITGATGANSGSRGIVASTCTYTLD